MYGALKNNSVVQLVLLLFSIFKTHEEEMLPEIICKNCTSCTILPNLELCNLFLCKVTQAQTNSCYESHIYVVGIYHSSWQHVVAINFGNLQ